MDVVREKGTTPHFGRWSHDFTDGSWWWSEEMIAMYDADLANPGDVDQVFARLHPEDREVVRERLQSAMDQRAPLSGQYRFETIGRGQRVFAFVGDPEEVGGAVVALRGYTIDVTEEVTARANEAVVGATRSRGAIEQVKGALMVEYQMTQTTAFETLRHFSMLHNVKVSVLAEETVSRMSDPVDTVRVVPASDRGTMLALLESVAADLAPTRERAG